MTGAASAVRLRIAPLRHALAPGPRLQGRLALVAAAALLLIAGYMLWLRDSSLVRVQTVTVTGLTGDDAARVRSALSGAARGTTTLHVDRESIERAAQAFPTIRAVEVRPDFPSSMRIHVIEHRPAALLVVGGRRVPVAGDGSVLTGLPVRGALPTIEVEGALPARRLEPGAALDAVHVAGRAPAPLSGRLEKVERERGRGVVVHVKDGPELVFGDTTRLAAKWAAAVRVLADRDAAGAEYVDVRIPERPAAGGLPVETVAPVAPAGSATTGATAPQEPGSAAQSAPGEAAEPAPASPATPAPAAPAQPRELAPQAPQQPPAAPLAQPGGGVAPNTQP